MYNKLSPCNSDTIFFFLKSSSQVHSSQFITKKKENKKQIKFTSVKEITLKKKIMEKPF